MAAQSRPEGHTRHRPQLWLSCAQVYNDAIYDLLSTPGPSGARPGLHLKENATGHITIPSLKKVWPVAACSTLACLKARQQGIRGAAAL